MLERFRQWLAPHQNKSDVYNLLREMSPQASTEKPTYKKLATDGYAGNPYVMAAVRERAMAVAGIKWSMTQESEDGSEKRIDQHPMLERWQNPNQQYGLPRLLEKTVSYLDLAGEVYLYGINASQNPDAPIDEIHCMQPGTVEPVISDSLGIVTGYKIRRGQHEIFVPAQAMLHLMHFNPNDPYRGLSPLSAANRSIELNNASKEFNTAFVKNYARPSGALIFENELTQQQFEKMKSDLENAVAGPQNAGRPRIFQGKIRWEQFGLSPSEVSWIDGQKLSAREIAIALQVPPELIGDNENKTYSNYMEARKAFYQETVLPLMDYIQAEVNRWLAPKYDLDESFKLSYVPGDIEALKDDRGASVDVAVKGYQAGVMTRNEAREVVGLDDDPSPESDEFKEPQLGGFGAPNQLSAKSAQPRFWGPNQLRTFSSSNLEEKAAQFQAVENIRERYEFAVRSAVRQQFRADRSALMKSLQHAHAISQVQNMVIATVNDQTKQWMDLLKSIYLAVGEDFAVGAYRDYQRNNTSLTQSKSLLRKQPMDSEKAFKERWKDDVAAFVDHEGAVMVQKINESTMRKIQKIIQDGMAEGKSVRDIEIGIDDLYLEEIIPNRSEVIARTETIRASNLGSQRAAITIANSVGRKLKRFWLSTRDMRTRDSHLAMDGSTTDSSGFWIVGDGVGGTEKLSFPGDPTASPGNTINCRCTETYSLAEEDQT